jgi:hypothetical protein
MFFQIEGAATVLLMLKINRLGLMRGVLLTVSLASGAWVAGARAADVPQAPAKVPAQASTPGGKPAPSHYQPDRFAGRAGKYYELHWGIDSIVVKLVESGELVRFSYRVLDPAKAQPLNEKANAASLDDPQAGVSLVVPTMEKIGALRQSAAPEAGHSYWMTFSNKGRRVARGHRVDVLIGPFKASNLVVD